MFTAGGFSYRQHKWCNKLGHQPKHLLTLLQFLQLLLPHLPLQLPHGLLVLLALPVTGILLLLEQSLYRFIHILPSQLWRGGSPSRHTLPRVPQRVVAAVCCLYFSPRAASWMH